MTLLEYRQKFGPELRQHLGQPWFAHFLDMLKAEHPLKAIKREKADGQLLNGAAVYLNSILGYEECLDKIEKAQQPASEESPEPPSNYADEKE